MIFGLFISGVAMILIAFTSELAIAIVCCCATEISTVTIYSIPYGLLGKYHCHYSVVISSFNLYDYLRVTNFIVTFLTLLERSKMELERFRN